MNDINDNPPKHTDIGSSNKPKRLNLLASMIRKMLIKDDKKKIRKVNFTLEEKIILGKKEKICPIFGEYSTKKAYKEALEMKKRAQKYLAKVSGETQKVALDTEENILNT